MISDCCLRLYFQISPNSQKSWKIWFFYFPLLSYFLSDWEDTLSSLVCDQKRGSQFLIKMPVFKKKNCSYLCKIFVPISVLWILFPSLTEGKIWKISIGILMQLLTNSWWDGSTNGIYCFWIYVKDIGTIRYITTWKHVPYTIVIRSDAVHRGRGIYLIIKLSLFV